MNGGQPRSEMVCDHEIIYGAISVVPLTVLYREGGREMCSQLYNIPRIMGQKITCGDSAVGHRRHTELLIMTKKEPEYY